MATDTPTPTPIFQLVEWPEFVVAWCVVVEVAGVELWLEVIFGVVEVEAEDA